MVGVRGICSKLSEPPCPRSGKGTLAVFWGYLTVYWLINPPPQIECAQQVKIIYNHSQLHMNEPMEVQAQLSMLLDIREDFYQSQEQTEIMAAGPDDVVSIGPKIKPRMFSYLVLDSLKRKFWTDLENQDHRTVADLIRVFADSLIEIKDMHGMKNYALQRIHLLIVAGKQMGFSLEKMLKMGEEDGREQRPVQPTHLATPSPVQADLEAAEDRASERSSVKSGSKQRTVRCSTMSKKTLIFGKRWFLPKRAHMTSGEKKKEETIRMRQWRAQKRHVHRVEPEAIITRAQSRDEISLEERQPTHTKDQMMDKLQIGSSTREASSAKMDIEAAEQPAENVFQTNEYEQVAEKSDPVFSQSSKPTLTRKKHFNRKKSIPSRSIKPSRWGPDKTAEARAAPPMNGEMLEYHLTQFKNDFADKITKRMKLLKKLGLWLTMENITNQFQDLMEEALEYQFPFPELK